MRMPAPRIHYGFTANLLPQGAKWRQLARHLAG
jgi:hypothetical protein